MKSCNTSLLLMLFSLLALSITDPVMAQHDRVKLEQQLINASNSEALGLVHAAFEQRDVSLLAFFLVHPRTSSYVLSEYQASQDIKLRASMAVAILKDDSFWASPSDDVSRGAAMRSLSLAEAIAPVIEETLKDPGPLNELAINPHLRKQIAARLEGPPQKGETLLPTSQSPKPPSQTLRAIEPSSSKKSLESKSTSIPSEGPTSSTPWSIIVVLIVAGCGLLWLVLKRRS